MDKFSVFGVDYLKKTVGEGGTSGRIYVPREWIGKEVVVILKSEGDEE